MMTIGDPKNFAIILQKNTDFTYRPWMYGVFCISICGQLLGSMTNQATLNSILSALRAWRDNLPNDARRSAALMAADTLTAFLSMEEADYGLEPTNPLIPASFRPVPVSETSSHQILYLDGLEDYSIYCIEDETWSRLIYARIGERPRECRVLRSVVTEVLLQTIDTLEAWFARLPEPPS